MPQKELYKYYETHDCFLFPSFHDSGGMVVLEAFSNGLPVICLDIGGPNKLVDSSCGFKVKVQNKNSSQIVNEISEILKNLHGNRNRLDELRKNAFKKAEFYNWCNIVQSSYNYIDQKLNNN